MAPKVGMSSDVFFYAARFYSQGGVCVGGCDGFSHFLFGIIILMHGDRQRDKHAHSLLKTLTETTVAVVNHEISSQSSGGEVVHAAGPVRHVPHHDRIRLREPAKYAETLISTVTLYMHVPLIVIKAIDTRSMPGTARL